MTVIGFVGLGIMGSPMAANLAAAGHRVLGFDVSAERRAQLVAAGGEAVASIAETTDADVVVTMLPDSPQVEEVVLGPGGVLEHAKPGLLLIDMSTIRPETSRRVAVEASARGVRALDAPVSGGEKGAIDGVLSIMVGGAAADFAAAQPVLEVLGQTIVHVGVSGAGQTVKAANQMVVAGTYALVAEAIVLLEASGVDASAGLDVLAGGLAGSRILELKRASMVARNFTPGFRIDLHHKDMGIALAAAREADVALPVTGLIAQLVAAARAQGLGSFDHSVLLTVLEKVSGKGCVMTIARIPCMEAVAQVLRSEGVDTVFGIPGAAILPLYAALQHSGIKHLTVRHEEGGTHAADGWARATGNVGVSIGTSGPAGTNMITGLYTALADSIPIICITGQAQRGKLHQEAFQAVDIVEIARPVTKWAVQLKEPGQAPWLFREAFRVARSGRPGPVLIDLPIDVQKGFCSYDAALDAPLPVDVPAPRPEPIRAAIEMLLAAQRPLILAGGGVIVGEAWDELRELAEHLQVPVQVTLMGKGAFPEDHPLFAGMAGIQTSTRWGNAAFLESDAVLAVGARFGDRHTGDLETYRRGRKFIHVDIEPMQIGRVFEPDLGIVGHARPTLAALAAEARRTVAAREPAAWPERVAHLRGTLLRRDDFDDVPIKPPRVFREINRFFGPDTTFVTAIGLYQIWSGQFQQTFRPRHYMVCGQAGPLGWEIPAAIGVKCAYPERPVAVVVGDYSFQFLMEEVAVAAQYKIPFVIVMINNEYLGLIRQAELGYDMNYAVDLHFGEGGIDHVKVMEAMGCPARRVEQPGDIADALAWAALESEAAQLPVLVEVMVEREANAAMGPGLDTVKEFEPVPDLLEVGERP